MAVAPASKAQAALKNITLKDAVSLSVPASFTHQHLQLLAEIAERFADADFRARLRAAPDAAAMHALLAGDAA